MQHREKSHHCCATEQTCKHPLHRPLSGRINTVTKFILIVRVCEAQDRRSLHETVQPSSCSSRDDSSYELVAMHARNRFLVKVKSINMSLISEHAAVIVVMATNDKLHRLKTIPHHVRLASNTSGCVHTEGDANGDVAEPHLQTFFCAKEKLAKIVLICRCRRKRSGCSNGRGCCCRRLGPCPTHDGEQNPPTHRAHRGTTGMTQTNFLFLNETGQLVKSRQIWKSSELLANGASSPARYDAAIHFSYDPY